MATKKTTMFVTNCTALTEDMDPIKAYEYVDEVLAAPYGVYATLEEAKAAILEDVKADWKNVLEDDYSGGLEWSKIKRVGKLFCYEASTEQYPEYDFSIVARIYEMQVG